MRRRITRALFATAAAGATITSLSLAVAGPASAARTADVVTANSAGWAAGNVLVPTIQKTSSTWNFRFSSGTTTVPDISNTNINKNWYRQAFVAMLANQKAAATAELYYSGGWHVRFGQYYRNGAGYDAGTACTHTWLTSSQARLDVYYAQGTGRIEFTAYDGPDAVCTATLPAWTVNSVGGGSYREAYTGGIFVYNVTASNNNNGPYSSAAAFTRPTADTKLWAVSGVRYTSYNGTKGTVVGPWDYQQLIYGTSSSNVFANAPVLWNGGANFGVWLRA